VASHISQHTAKLPIIAVKDEGLHSNVMKATHSLDDVIRARHQEACLIAAERHEKEVIETVTGKNV